MRRDPDHPTTSGRLPAVSLLLLLLVVLAGGALPANAADDERTPLLPRRLFDQSRPGVEYITAEFTAQLTVPQAEVTFANQQALQARVTQRIQRGEVAATSTAAGIATIEEITRDPFRWVTPASRIYQETVKFSAFGSGFSISSDGYIVTNAHVVAPDQEDLKAAFLREAMRSERDSFIQKMGQDGLPQALATRYLSAMVRWATKSATLSKMQRRLAAVTSSGTGGITYPSEGRPAKLVTAGKELPGKDVAILKVEASNMATVPLGDDTALSTGDRLFVLGFPAPATFNPALSKDSQKEPTLTQGVLSAKKTVKQGFTVLQTDATMTHGNSGGPVFDEQGRVVGVATFGSVDLNTGHEVAGLNFAVPVSVVNELLAQVKVKPVEGPATQKYRSALDAFDKQWYKRALPLFKEVKTLDSTHPSVDRLLAASQAAVDQGRDRTPREILGLPVALFVGLTATIGLSIAGAFVTVAVRRRPRRARRRAVPAMSPVHPGPIPASLPGTPRPAPLETPAAMQQRDRFDHQSFRAIRPADPAASIASDAGGSGGAAGQTATPASPWWPLEEQIAEPSASQGSDVAPESDVNGRPPLRHRGRHERQPGRRIASSDPTQPSEPARIAPVGRWDGPPREHPPIQQTPALLVCSDCGHRSPSSLRFCEQCWNLLGSSD